VTLKTLLRQADRLRATYVVIVGDDEAAQGQVLLRNMETREQHLLSAEALCDVLVTRLEIR